MRISSNVGKIIEREDQTTSVGHVLIHARVQAPIWRANSDREKAVYRELYPVMAAERDRPLKDAEVVNAPVASNTTEKPPEFFHGMSPAAVKGTLPAPPPPQLKDQ